MLIDRKAIQSGLIYLIVKDVEKTQIYREKAGGLDVFTDRTLMFSIGHLLGFTRLLSGKTARIARATGTRL